MWWSSLMVGAEVASIVLVLAALSVLVMVVWAKLYVRTESDVALVRTGQGGLKVVLDGGLIVIPVVHEIQRISLSTMKLAVERSGKGALITKDRYRVDVTAEFYLKVQPVVEDVKAASRSLGERAMSANAVKELVEGKLIGALRTVAATMELDELHEQRDKFADLVQRNLIEDLKDNGLTLESVTITQLDQTDKEELDANNVFDAEGLKKITAQTEERRKDKNRIQRSAEAEIAKQDREAKELILTEQQKVAQATAIQIMNVEVSKAEKEAETQRFRIQQDEEVRRREILKEQSIALADVDKDQRVQEAQLKKETELIEKRRLMEETEIAKQMAIEVAQRSKQIGIIEKEKEREQREAEKLATVAERERADQLVITVEKTEEAKREKEVAIIHQQAESEKDRLQKQIAADARAYEIQKAAEAEAVAADQRAQAIERLAEAKLKEAQAHAEGQRVLIEARNKISKDVLLQEAAMVFIGKLPELVHEAMLPAEKISEIKVLNVQGMGALATNGNGASTAGGVVSSFLQAGAALPMLREILKFTGVDTDRHDLVEVARQAAEKIPGVKELVERVPEELRRPPASPKK